jgi:hypothetical protein
LGDKLELEAKAPENVVKGLSAAGTGGTRAGSNFGFSLLRPPTEKSAILSSPSENRLVSVISYQAVVDFLTGSEVVLLLDNSDDEAADEGSAKQDLNQCEAAIGLTLKGILQNPK